jgi:hypothetical protein
MDCKKFHNLISSYIDNELGLNEEDMLLQHLNICKNCSNYLKNFLIIRANVKKAFLYNVNIDLSMSIMKKIKNKKAHNKVTNLPLNKEFNKNKIAKKVLKSFELTFILLFFIFISFLLGNFYDKRTDTLEALVVQHLESSSNRVLQDVDNANFMQ